MTRLVEIFAAFFVGTCVSSIWTEAEISDTLKLSLSLLILLFSELTHYTLCNIYVQYHLASPRLSDCPGCHHALSPVSRKIPTTTENRGELRCVRCAKTRGRRAATATAVGTGEFQLHRETVGSHARWPPNRVNLISVECNL